MAKNLISRIAVKSNGLVSAMLLSAGVLASQIGCGEDCRHPEDKYFISSQSYVRFERSSDFNVEKGLGENVNGKINLYETRKKPSPPNRYLVECVTVEGEDYFEFYVTKTYADGSYNFIAGNNGEPKGSVRSQVLKSEELEGVVSLRCAIVLPAEQDCKNDPITHIEKCGKSQEKEVIGAVVADLSSEAACFDWYYEDKYHEAIDE